MHRIGLNYPGFDTAELYASSYGRTDTSPPATALDGNMSSSLVQYQHQTNYGDLNLDLQAEPSMVEHIVKLVIEPGDGWEGKVQTQSLGLYPATDVVNVQPQIPPLLQSATIPSSVDLSLPAKRFTAQDSLAQLQKSQAVPMKESPPQLQKSQAVPMQASPQAAVSTLQAVETVISEAPTLVEAPPASGNRDGLLRIGHRKGANEFGRGKDDVVGCKTQ